jgi:hypothetical protein
MDIKNLYLLDIALRINSVSKKLKDKIKEIEESTKSLGPLHQIQLYEESVKSRKRVLKNICKITKQKL